MPEPASQGATTSVSRTINAPRKAVYQAFLDPVSLASWLPPETMTGKVHQFEPWVGGKLRMSLVYQDPQQSPSGKTSEDTDTFEGRFVELVPDEKVVWAVTFDSQDPGFAGEMRITWNLADAAEATEVTVRCENIPQGVRPEDNEMGSRSSLRNLAALLE